MLEPGSIGFLEFKDEQCVCLEVCHGGSLRFDIEFNIEPKRFTISSVSERETTLVEWILMLETVRVMLKAKFADHVIEMWDKKKGFSEKEKELLLKEIDKLEGPHPNEKEHDEILNQVFVTLIDKLEIKNNMEHLN